MQYANAVVSKNNELTNKINQFEIRQLFKFGLWGLAAMGTNEEITVSTWRQEGCSSFNFFSPGSTSSQVLLCRIAAITKSNSYANCHQEYHELQGLLLLTCLAWHKDVFLWTKQGKDI